MTSKLPCWLGAGIALVEQNAHQLLHVQEHDQNRWATRELSTCWFAICSPLFRSQWLGGNWPYVPVCRQHRKTHPTIAAGILFQLYNPLTSLTDNICIKYLCRTRPYPNSSVQDDSEKNKTNYLAPNRLVLSAACLWTKKQRGRNSRGKNRWRKVGCKSHKWVIQWFIYR